jgi:GntR family transcriptional regulator, transcriptional repressor for pyruvate dehydrogenase complex
VQAKSDIHFEPIEQPRAHEYAAEQIRRQINLRLLPAGQPLPPERELARMFGIGRATVQQAIQILERDGLVQRRRGRAGGTFVTGPVSPRASKLRLLGRLREERGLIEEALTFRLSVEPEIAASAAESRSEQDLAALRASCEAAESAADDAEFMRLDTEFHLAVGQATTNRFFIDATESIRLALNHPLIALPDSRLWHARSNEEHRLILNAIEAQRPARARKALRAHIINTDTSIRALLHAL